MRASSIPKLALAAFLSFLILLPVPSVAQPSTTRSSTAALNNCVPGPHTGVINTDQIWCAADNPHLLEGEVIVEAGSTLTLEPGVEVQGGIYDGLTVRGVLQAIGAIDQEILFTSKENSGSAGWRGLGFLGATSSGSLYYVTLRYGGMYHSEVGSYAILAAKDMSASGLEIVNSHIQKSSFWTSGHTYGLTIDNSPFLLANSTVSDMGSASDDSAVRISGSGTSGSILHSEFSANTGTTMIIDPDVQQVLISENHIHDNWLGLVVSSGNVTVEKNIIERNTSFVSTRGGLIVNGGSPIIRENILRNNTADRGGGMSIYGSPQVINNVITGNHAAYACSAIDIAAGSAPAFWHNTISGNDGGDGSAICIEGEGPHGVFNNTIIAGQPVGVQSAWENATLELHHTLWDDVAQVESGDGSIINDTPFYGKAMFDLDGYHLTRFSAAVGKGLPSGVSEDLEGDARPQPPGTLPDLGADEFTGSQDPSFWVEFYSDEPRLEIREEGGVRVEQNFFIFWNYGSDETNPDPLDLVITAALDSSMVFDEQESDGAGELSYTQNCQVVTWNSTQSVKKDDFGFTRFAIHYNSEALAGDPSVLDFQLQAGSDVHQQTITTTIPIFPPKITWPIDGEGCSAQFINMVVTGYAMPGSIIRLYEDDVYKATGTADDEDGIFNIVYNSDEAGIDDYTRIYVRACNPNELYDCGDTSNTITVTKQLSFWCPRRSYWEGDYHTVHGGESVWHATFGFRDAQGMLATEAWTFFAGTGLENSTLSLHLCICPGGIDYPSSTWVIANGTRYNPSGGTTNIPSFSIPAASGAVEFHGVCSGSELVDTGTILVDPDGFVFDVTKGFMESDPSKQFVLQGAKVTLMVSEPSLGGWVQWPAHLYANQINPQITGSDGYYSFYTPPGDYYVRVTDLDGFQSWRSPLITVVDKLVHLNVPLTPFTTPAAKQVQLGVSGPSPATVFLLPGETAEWQAESVPNISTVTRQIYTTDPVLRLLSVLDPHQSVAGWDGGMLAPGAVFRREFIEPGVYAYSDGLGYTGWVVVGGQSLYLPLVTR